MNGDAASDLSDLSLRIKKHTTAVSWEMEKSDVQAYRRTELPDKKFLLRIFFLISLVESADPWVLI